MTAHTLPKNPCYAFSPAYDLDNDLQQIRIVIHDMSGYIPTTLAARSMRAENGAPDSKRPCSEPTALLRSRPDVIRPQPRRASHHHAIHTGRLKTIA